MGLMNLFWSFLLLFFLIKMDNYVDIL